jgi:ubiquinone biosynthesis protein
MNGTGMILSLPQSVRSLQRFQEIVRVLVKHGFGHFIDRLDLRSYMSLPQWWRTSKAARPPADHLSAGQRIARVCEELGPTFVKMAQIASTRPDLIPANVLNDLKSLQDRVEPFDPQVAKQIVEQDLGQPVDQAFATFEENAFASGSIAQVHRASDAAGNPLIVKVRRPDIERTIELDIHILENLAQLAEALIPEIQLYHPNLIIEEFSRSIRRELDFVNEASAITRFHEAFRDDETVWIPKVYWDMTGPRVLTMEEIRGIPVGKLIDNGDERCDRRAVANNLATAFFRQFFEIGIFHADPHPGNLLISPPGRIGLIDFGNVGQVDDELAGQLTIALLGALRKEIDLVIDVLADVGAVGSKLDRTLLRRDLSDMLNKYYGLPLKRLDLEPIFNELTDILRRNDIALPRNFILLIKSLVEVAGVALQLDPEFNLVELLLPRIKGLLRDRFNLNRLARTAGMSGWHLINILKNSPGQLRDALRRMAAGKWEINIRHRDLEVLGNELDRSSNRLSVAIIIAAVLIASSSVIKEQSTFFFGISLSTVGVIGYIVAGLMGLSLLVAIWRSGRLS